MRDLIESRPLLISYLKTKVDEDVRKGEHEQNFKDWLKKRREEQARKKVQDETFNFQ